MGIIIPLDSDTRKLYVRYDYEFFLKRNIDDNNYSAKEIALIYSSYRSNMKKLQSDLRKNKAQTLFHIDGAIRKMHSGGSLPSSFELDESRDLTIIDFEGNGECWAYFDVWKKHEKRKILKKTLWNNLIKIGALLGIALTIIKIIEEV